MKLDDVRKVDYSLGVLRRIEASVNKLDCRACNGYLNELHEKRDDRKRDTLLKKARDVAKRLGLKIYYQSDPRGCSLYLVDKTCKDDYSHGMSIC